MAHNKILCIAEANGKLWFGTGSGGVAIYDGVTWTSLDTRDSLVHNRVNCIHADAEGNLWFGTIGGIVRYRPSPIASPRVRIVAVTTDRRYTDLDAMRPAVAGDRITFEYTSVDFKTHSDKRLYRYKLEPYERDWNSPTKETDFLNF